VTPGGAAGAVSRISTAAASFGRTALTMPGSTTTAPFHHSRLELDTVVIPVTRIHRLDEHLAQPFFIDARLRKGASATKGDDHHDVRIARDVEPRMATTAIGPNARSCALRKRREQLARELRPLPGFFVLEVHEHVAAVRRAFFDHAGPPFDIRRTIALIP